MNTQINTLSSSIQQNLRDVPDFPKPGIVFKDITPLLANPELLNQCIESLATQIRQMGAEAIAGIEARGFIFGSLVAQKLQVPFLPIRKKGKLPWKTKQIEYALEYGTAVIEMHEDACTGGKKIVIVDDLLATGGTAEAAYSLIKEVGGDVCCYAFVVELGFLKGKEILEKYAPVLSLTEIS